MANIYKNSLSDYVMKWYIITNNAEINKSLIRYLKYIFNGEIFEQRLLTDFDIMISQNILDFDFFIVEAYKIGNGKITDRGAEIFKTFTKMKKCLLFYIQAEKEPTENLKKFLLKLPEETHKLKEKIKNIQESDIKLTEEDEKRLDEMFVYKEVSDHHGHRR